MDRWQWLQHRLDAVDPTQLRQDLDAAIFWGRLFARPEATWTAEQLTLLREVFVDACVTAEHEAFFAGAAMVRSISERVAVERITAARDFARAAARRLSA